MAVIQWKARYVKVKIGDKLASVGTKTDLYDQVTGSLYEDVMKDCEITKPERDIDTEKLLGEDATTNAQNQISEDADDTDSEFSATTVGAIKDFNKFFTDSWATGAGDGADMTMYNFGADRPANGVAIAVRFIDGTSIHDFLLNDCKMVNPESLTVEADGSAEGEINFKSASKDTYEAYNHIS